MNISVKGHKCSYQIDSFDPSGAWRRRKVTGWEDGDQKPGLASGYSTVRYGISPSLIGKSSWFIIYTWAMASIAMLNNQRVYTNNNNNSSNSNNNNKNKNNNQNQKTNTLAFQLPLRLASRWILTL